MGKEVYPVRIGQSGKHGYNGWKIKEDKSHSRLLCCYEKDKYEDSATTEDRNKGRYTEASNEMKNVVQEENHLLDKEETETGEGEYVRKGVCHKAM